MVAPVPPMAEPTTPPTTAPPTVPTVVRSIVAQPPRPIRETAVTTAAMNFVFMGSPSKSFVRYKPLEARQPVRMTVGTAALPDCRNRSKRFVVTRQECLQGDG